MQRERWELWHRNKQFEKYRSNCKDRKVPKKMENNNMIIQIQEVLKNVKVLVLSFITSSQQNTNFLNHDFFYSHLFFTRVFLSDADSLPFHHNFNFKLLFVYIKPNSCNVMFLYCHLPTFLWLFPLLVLH